MLRFLRHHCVQARAASEDGPESIRRAGLRPPAILITRGPIDQQLGEDRGPRPCRRTPQSIPATDRGARGRGRTAPRGLLLRRMRSLVAHCPSLAAERVVLRCASEVSGRPQVAVDLGTGPRATSAAARSGGRRGQRQQPGSARTTPPTGGARRRSACRRGWRRPCGRRSGCARGTPLATAMVRSRFITVSLTEGPGFDVAVVDRSTAAADVAADEVKAFSRPPAAGESGEPCGDLSCR